MAGKPSEEVRSDDYAEWTGGMRGMLRWAGFPGTFGNSSDARVVSADDEEWRQFLIALHSVFGDKPFTVKDIVSQLRTTHPLLDTGIDQAALPGELAEKWARVYEGRDGGFRKSLGWWLKNRLGRYADGWSVAAAGEDTHTHTVQYVVRPPNHAGFRGFGTNGKTTGDAGFRGFRGFEPPIAIVDSSILIENEGEPVSQWGGENLQNPETPQGDDDWLRSMPGRCGECGWHVASQGHAEHCVGLVRPSGGN